MSNVFTLDSLREEVEKEFAPVEITLPDDTVVVLRKVMRLPKKDRDAVLKKMRELSAIEADDDDEAGNKIDLLTDKACEILMLVADNGRALLKELGNDTAVVMKVLEIWMETAQPGEAKPSPA